MQFVISYICMRCLSFCEIKEILLIDPHTNSKQQFLGIIIRESITLSKLLHTAITETMNAAFQVVLQENVAIKDQTTNIYIQVKGLEATVLHLNSTVP